MRNPHKTWLFWQLSHFPIFGPGATACGPLAACPLSRLTATAPPKGEPSLASPLGGGGLALARTERARCQRPLRMGCVEALANCPLSRLAATASRLLALSVTAAAVPAPPRGEPSRCATKSLRKTKSRLPLWGRWTRVSEDGEGQVPAAPSHGLCRSAGELPSQSPNGASSPKGGAKSRLPLWGRCHAKGMTERATAPPAGKNASLFP